MRRSKSFGPSDKLVLWQKPKSCPKGLTKKEFASLPLDLVLRKARRMRDSSRQTLREHYYINIPGFRTKQVTLVTTLLDAIEYPIQELVELYDLRWQVEINLNHRLGNFRDGAVT
jgi:hypothetical protein